MSTSPKVKTWIIEHIFKQRWDPATRTLSSSIVTFRDIVAARQLYNAQHPGTHEPVTNEPNFFKDFIRRKNSANRRWPSTVFAAGYTGRQTTGGGQCFEFIPLRPGQQEPFPITLVPNANTPRHLIQTATMPVESRRLGRHEETWTTQVVVNVRIVETHFILFSPRRAKIVQVGHLQISAKLGKTEIDALYLLRENGLYPPHEVLVCCEVKGFGQDLIEEQILQQARGVFHIRTVTQDAVIPMGIKVVGESQIYVVEFEAIARQTAEATTVLQVASDAVYELLPPVPGIGKR